MFCPEVIVWLALYNSVCVYMYTKYLRENSYWRSSASDKILWIELPWYKITSSTYDDMLLLYYPSVRPISWLHAVYFCIPFTCLTGSTEVFWWCCVCWVDLLMLFLLGRLVGVVVFVGSACWCCCFCWVDLLFLLGRLVVVFVGLVLLFGWLVGVFVGSACSVLFLVKTITSMALTVNTEWWLLTRLGILKICLFCCVLYPENVKRVNSV